MKQFNINISYKSLQLIIQVYWLFLAIFLLAIIATLAFVPGFRAPEAVLYMSFYSTPTSQIPSIIFPLALASIIGYLSFKKVNIASLPSILSFILLTIVAVNLFTAT